MKRSTRDRAVNALRTTTAPQTRGALRRTERYLDIPAGFCALGVLVAEVGELYVQPIEVAADAGQSGWLNGPAYDWIDESGLPAGSIQHLNDNERLTFAEIADWIEANVPVEEDDHVPVDHLEVEDDWPPDYVPAGWVAETAGVGA